MMKLILSVTLLWMLSSSAEALQCVRSDISSTVRHHCRSKEEVCATVAVKDNTERHWRVFSRSCVPPFLCTVPDNIFSYSNSLGTVSASIHCCNTDGCNYSRQNISFPDIQAKQNGLQCFSCIDSPGCNETVQCVGNQDRCMNGNVTIQDNTHPFRGCVSANVCEALSYLEDQTALPEFYNLAVSAKCCGTSLCSSAWTVRLSVGPLLLGLVALIVF